jgi:hypothetical protein
MLCYACRTFHTAPHPGGRLCAAKQHNVSAWRIYAQIATWPLARSQCEVNSTHHDTLASAVWANDACEPL